VELLASSFSLLKVCQKEILIILVVLSLLIIYGLSLSHARKVFEVLTKLNQVMQVFNILFVRLKETRNLEFLKKKSQMEPPTIRFNQIR
jgi:dolichol kinase